MGFSTRSFEDLFSFYRPAPVWVWGGNGLLESVPANQPAYDDDPRLDGIRRIRIERAATNYWHNSADVSSVQGSDDFQFEPAANLFDAGGNISYLVSNTANIAARALVSGTIVSDGSDLSTWVILEQGTAVSASIGLQDRTQLVFSGRVDYDWSTGEAVITAGNSSGTRAPKILGPFVLRERGPNGGKLVLFGVSGDVLSGNEARVIIYATGVAANADSVYFHHAQFEKGKRASSPIVTSGVALGRSADVCSVDMLSPWFRQGVGTILVKAVVPDYNDSGKVGAVLTLNNTSNSYYNALIRETASGLGVVSRDQADAQYSTTYPNVDPSLGFKLGFSFKDGQFISAANGQSHARAPGGTLNKTQNKLELGRGFGDYADGWIEELIYIPRALSQAELEGRTA